MKAYDFRTSLLKNDKDFKEKFEKYYNNGQILEFDDAFFDLIQKDKTPIKYGNETILFKDIFETGKNSGRCFQCSHELAFIMKKNGYDVNVVQGKNINFISTPGSKHGGHYWLETTINNKKIAIDTSLMVLIDENVLSNLDYIELKKQSVDEIINSDIEMQRYYNNMVTGNEKVL